jgi:hypothetical protein
MWQVIPSTFNHYLPVTTDATTAATGSVQLAGGLGCAKTVWAKNIHCDTAPQAATDVVRLSDLPGSNLSFVSTIGAESKSGPLTVYFGDVNNSDGQTVLSQTLQLFLEGNMVRLIVSTGGSFASGSTHTPAIAMINPVGGSAYTLPSAYRPVAQLNAPIHYVNDGTGGIGFMQIQTTGGVVLCDSTGAAVVAKSKTFTVGPWSATYASS